MTPAQLQTLKAYIAADPVLAAQPMDGDGNNNIADALNVATSDYYVWKTSVSRADTMGDSFDWSQVDNLTVGQARIWDWLFDNGRSINPALSSIRTGITETWKGTSAKVAVATYILGVCKRFASVAEKLLAVGAGTSANPSVMGFEGQITSLIVDQARHA